LRTTYYMRSQENVIKSTLGGVWPSEGSRRLVRAPWRQVQPVYAHTVSPGALNGFPDGDADRPNVRQADNSWVIRELTPANGKVPLRSLGIELDFAEIHDKVEFDKPANPNAFIQSSSSCVAE